MFKDNENSNKDPSRRLSLENIEKFFISNKTNKTLPDMIRMQNIREFTQKLIPNQVDYFTWYLEKRPQLDAPVFNHADLRAEQKFFSKSLSIYEKYQMNEIKHLKGGYVPAYHNFQQYITRDFLEETDRCYHFPIADNFIAVLLEYLDSYGLLTDPKHGDILTESPRITAHIRRIIQFFIVPSQLYDRKPCDIEITMQKVYDIPYDSVYDYI